MRIPHLFLLTCVALVACGDDGSSDPSDDIEQAGESESESESEGCSLASRCDEVALPDVGPASDFSHGSSSFAALAFATHRGRDLLLRADEDGLTREAWALAKFAYGVLDDDIQDETVDVYLLQACGAPSAAWQLFASTQTTADGEHEAIHGVDDDGGRVFLQLPPLPIGRHRLHFVVKGDLSATDQYIEVLPADARIVVTDVDGTLTTTENEEFTALLTGQLPEARPDAAALMAEYAHKGFVLFYLTARPGQLMGRTREFLDDKGFPPGIVHTTLTLTGAVGASAADFKTAELSALAETGFMPTLAFGNKDTDATAYTNASIGAGECYYVQYDDVDHGGRRIDEYTELLDDAASLTAQCD